MTIISKSVAVVRPLEMDITEVDIRAQCLAQNREVEAAVKRDLEAGAENVTGTYMCIN